MGNDGGSIPKRDDLVKTKHRGEQVDPQQKESTRWQCCALSKRPLEEPIVSDPLGKLYNKSSVLEYLLDNDTFGEDGRQVAGHLVSLRDVIDLRMTLNQQATRRICPISLKEMGSGLGKMELRWIYMVRCGCVLTETGLKQVRKEPSAQIECPVCGKSQESLEYVTINPTDAEEEQMKIKLVDQRRKEKLAKEQRKLEKKERKKRKAVEARDLPTSSLGQRADEPNERQDAEDGLTMKSKKKPKVEVPKSKLGQEPNSSIVSSSLSKITQEVQKETQQSLVNLSSSTLSSIYGPRDANGKQLLGQQKESWMTRGTWTRYAA